MNEAHFTYILALLFGMVAGLRTFTAPAVVSWAVHLGGFNLAGSRLAFVGNGWVRWILTGLAVVELVVDQLPATPSRTVPWQFGGRMISGAFSGAVVGATAGIAWAGAVAGLIGAVMGTLVGSRARARLAGAFKNDHRAALLEDAVAVGGAVLVAFAGR